MFGDEVVEDGEKEVVRAVGSYDERGDRARDVLRGDVDGDVAGVRRRATGGDEKARGVGGVRRAEGAGVAGDAGVILAVGGGHGDIDQGALRYAGLDHGLGCRGVGGAQDEVAVCGRCRDSVGGELFREDVSGSVGVAGGWCGADGCCAHGGGRHLYWGRSLRAGERGGGQEEQGSAEEARHGRLRW